ncbi:MAG: HD domain-containing protein [Gammaproteobacteria bacterium]|nr:MAG: HD domain-containing protein [Gammaproteobacteria bacterium]
MVSQQPVPDFRTNVSRIDGILEPWRETIGGDFQGYRNHVIRMATVSLMLSPCNSDDQKKLEIAACFHDIGLWTAGTLDYLEPSLPPAEEYLKAHGHADWVPEVSQMILQHHKLTPVADGQSRLVEVFRRADLVDVSKGVVRFGLGRGEISQLKRAFPNAGFHAMLMRRTGRWLLRHPLNPLPMMKW